MAALDTNILVRFLVADDRKQFQIAKAFIDDVVREEPLFIPLSVSVELEWVLRSIYDLEKSEIINTFNQLLESREIEFHEEASLEVALNFYTESNADFADCLHAASAFTNQRMPLVTFDRKASRLENVELLE